MKFAFFNQKGGVGKTTTVVNLGAALAIAGYKTLVVDLDSQCNTTTGLGISSCDLNVYDLLFCGSSFDEICISCSIKNLYIIPSSHDLACASHKFVDAPEKEKFMLNIFNQFSDSFDYVLIDCPPSFDFLTINILVCASHIIVPVQCEYYALEGLSQVISVVDFVRNNLNPALQLEGVLMTMFDKRSLLNRQVVNDVSKSLRNLMYKSVIPRNVTISEASSFSEPVVIYDPYCTGAIAYLKFAEEFINRLNS